MAIMGKGEILLTGKPTEVLDSLKGSLWCKSITRSELPGYKENHKVILSHLHAGQTIIHVLSESQPEQGFEQIEANLEDVYFATLIGNNVPVAV